MAIETVPQGDARFESLNRGRNPRWPAVGESASRIALCDTTEDVAEALERFVHAGLRPTVRSGGHCYEGFVYNNPQGAIVDLSMMQGTQPVAGAPKYRIAAGTTLGQVYTELHHRYGVLIPGGTCVTVGAGGHISGGGYGLLSRMHGITPDWLTALDIVTVDHAGKATVRRVDKSHDADLFRACRGGGIGSFGVITNFYFDTLPKAPTEVAKANLSFSWDGMTEEKFARILTLYGNYWDTRGRDADTWGIFTLFNVSHRDSGRFGMSVQFCNQDGTCRDLRPLEEFLSWFDECKPEVSKVSHPVLDAHLPPVPEGAGQVLCGAKHTVTKLPWLEATVTGNIGLEQRRKHKSTYMKRNFTPYETACYYKYLTMKVPGIETNHGTCLMDSYGGAANKAGMVEETAAPQRSSIMKMHFTASWADASADAANLKWIHDFYEELYSGPDADAAHRGTPYPGESYEGCYINYPDVDMLQYPYWQELYYGNKGLVPFLQNVKRKYDPNNIFHHAMSIRA